MQIAMVGLGRMGANMVRRLQAGGHECVAYDVNEAAVAAMEAEGARGARTPQEVIDALETPRHIWLMVPAAYVTATIEAFRPLLSPGDTLIDGGNSWYRDDVDRAAPLAAEGIHYPLSLAPGECVTGGRNNESSSNPMRQPASSMPAKTVAASTTRGSGITSCSATASSARKIA